MNMRYGCKHAQYTLVNWKWITSVYDWHQWTRHAATCVTRRPCFAQGQRGGPRASGTRNVSRLRSRGALDRFPSGCAARSRWLNQRGIPYKPEGWGYEGQHGILDGQWTHNASQWGKVSGERNDEQSAMST
eukprot:9471716-Pyramimonas_sp.AAC.1